MSEPTVPFYKRELLPRWFPGWLAASLLIATGFSVCFGLFLEGGNRFSTAAIAGLIGFSLGLVILSITAERRQLDNPNHLSPPAVIRRPIMTAIVSVWPLLWVVERRVVWPGGQTIVTGVAAEVIGIIGLVVIIGLLGFVNLKAYRRESDIVPSLFLALVVAVIAMVIAVMAVA